MKETRYTFVKVIAGLALAFAFIPSAALASGQSLRAAPFDPAAISDAGVQDESGAQPASSVGSEAVETNGTAQAVASSATVRAASTAQEQQRLAAEAAARKADYTIPFDRALIDEIGTQEETGHAICCPAFSCAYADAVLDGTVNDHSYYGCYSCVWTDWGGGDSSFRCVGSDEELLREAYDEIAQGRPTVIHVAASYGEHWIALIGYVDADDPDNLTLGNFVALDPWDGSQIIAGESFSLYGDGCEHVSDR